MVVADVETVGTDEAEVGVPTARIDKAGFGAKTETDEGGPSAD